MAALAFALATSAAPVAVSLPASAQLLLPMMLATAAESERPLAPLRAAGRTVRRSMAAASGSAPSALPIFPTEQTGMA